MSELSRKQRRFVAEYLKDQNAKQAAIRAGYSAASAEVNGPRLLRNAQVKAGVDAALAKVEEKAETDRAWVLKSLREVAERCMQHQPVMEFDYVEKEMRQKMECDPKTGKRVGVYEFDSAGANRALELIGKHLKMFTDKVDLGGELLEKLVAGSQEKAE